MGKKYDSGHNQHAADANGQPIQRITRELLRSTHLQDKPSLRHSALQVYHWCNVYLLTRLVMLQTTTFSLQLLGQSGVSRCVVIRDHYCKLSDFTGVKKEKKSFSMCHSLFDFKMLGRNSVGIFCLKCFYVIPKPLIPSFSVTGFVLETINMYIYIHAYVYIHL